ncbi:O-antigen ligase family protein [Candidatus Microgenomates bacterium]|nr:O-antigen ligase family protein [Candidatus Microgenomates bacterium]
MTDIQKSMKIIFYLSLVAFVLGSLGELPLFIPGVHVYLSDLTGILLIIYQLINFPETIRFVRRDKISGGFLLFILACFISLLLTPIRLTLLELGISAMYPVRLLIYFGYYLTVSLFIKSKKIQPNKLIKLLMYAGLTLAIFGWLQYFLYPNLRNLFYLGWDPHLGRIFSTFLDPNYFGLLTVLTLVISFCMHTSIISHPEFISGSSPKKMLKQVQHDNFIYWVVRLFLLITLLFTYSRSSYLAMFGVSLFYSLVKRKFYYFILLVLILVGGAFLLPRTEGIGVQLERTFSFTERVKNWQEAVTIFAKNPITGVGFNTLRYARRQYDIPIDDWQNNHAAAGVDNSFLFVLATTGLLGLFLFIKLLVRIYLHGGLLVRATLVAISIHSLFTNSFFFPWILYWFWIVVAIDRKD